MSRDIFKDEPPELLHCLSLLAAIHEALKEGAEWLGEDENPASLEARQREAAACAELAAENCLALVERLRGIALRCQNYADVQMAGKAVAK